MDDTAPDSAPFGEPNSVELVAALQAKVTELEESLIRARADFQNLQRRSTTERTEAIRYANADLIRPLLNVLDDLERTLSAVDSHADAAAVGAGVRLAHENFMKVLRDNGVEPIEAAHQKFDPAIHNALMRQPSAELPAGTVLQQVAKGFRLKDRVLRPAMVIVSSGVDSESKESVASRA